MLRRTVLAALIASSSLLVAQDWHGDERVRGRVRGADGSPAAGARILLRLAPGTAGPPEAVTDVEGRFKIARIAPGAWSIAIDHAAHVVSRGRVAVRAGVSEPIEIRLRSLEEVPPMGLEGGEAILAEWIDRGDSLLRDGRVAAAREAYGRALAALPWRDLEPVLDRLYGAAGRASDARAELEALAAEPAPPAETPQPLAQPAWPERPLVPAEAHRTGRFRMPDPRRAGESFEVYVPEAYAAGEPHGALVWISPGPFGGTERREIWKLLDERRVIWIGANRSGNDRSPSDRAALALDAAALVQELYDVDRARVWVGGYSGGGRVASGLALLSPDVFRGGLFVMGCDFYRDVPVPFAPGSTWRAALREPPRLRELRREHRFVLLTGFRDFNVSQCRAVAEAFAREGFRHAVLLEAPALSHYDPVPEAWWGRALSFLDGMAAVP